MRPWECSQTDTDRHTETDFIICPMLYAIAIGQIKMPTHMMSICVKFHQNPSIKHEDTASCEIGVNGQTTDGRADNEQTAKTKSKPKWRRLNTHWTYYTINNADINTSVFLPHCIYAGPAGRSSPWAKCLSICQTYEFWKTKETYAYILTPQKRSTHLVLRRKELLVGMPPSTWNFGPKWPHP